LERSIRTVDASVAGLGGCPYARGATGNVATEDVVYMLDGLGMETGIDLDKLVDAAEFICGVLGRPSNSRAGTAIAAKRENNA
jgi:hydroxymethylglutaryl-CoA lyase